MSEDSCMQKEQATSLKEKITPYTYVPFDTLPLSIQHILQHYAACHDVDTRYQKEIGFQQNFSPHNKEIAHLLDSVFQRLENEEWTEFKEMCL